MVEAYNISKSFGETKVLHDVTCKFEQGKTNLVIGRSGSGKTVLVKCLVGLFDIDEGKVLFDGRDYSSMNFNERKGIRKELGMLFQGGALFDSFTVEENIIFPLTMFSDMNHEEKIERANFCLKRVDLENKNALYPSELSGGMKKRVAIARAISINPKYLFCDEPNSGLDPRTSILIDQLISELTIEFNMTTIINTHDMNSVMEIGERIYFIHEGHLWWDGTNDEILYTDNEELNKFVYSSELLRKLKK